MIGGAVTLDSQQEGAGLIRMDDADIESIARTAYLRMDYPAAITQGTNHFHFKRAVRFASGRDSLFYQRTRTLLRKLQIVFQIDNAARTGPRNVDVFRPYRAIYRHTDPRTCDRDVEAALPPLLVQRPEVHRHPAGS